MKDRKFKLWLLISETIDSLSWPSFFVFPITAFDNRCLFSDLSKKTLQSPHQKVKNELLNESVYVITGAMHVMWCVWET